MQWSAKKSTNELLEVLYMGWKTYLSSALIDPSILDSYTQDLTPPKNVSFILVVAVFQFFRSPKGKNYHLFDLFFNIGTHWLLGNHSTISLGSEKNHLIFLVSFKIVKIIRRNRLNQLLGIFMFTAVPKLGHMNFIDFLMILDAFWSFLMMLSAKLQNVENHSLS